MRRKTLLLMLLMALFASGAWAQTAYTNYTLDGGSVTGSNCYQGDNSTNYGYLIDNNLSSGHKYCVVYRNDTWYGDVYVDFHSAEPIIPKGYVLYTGDDTYNNPNRRPKAWRIEAKLNSSDSWTTLTTKTDATLSTTNCAENTFNEISNNTTAYQYFRFTITAIMGKGIVELQDFHFIATVQGGGDTPSGDETCEDFESVTGTAYNSAGSMPTGWYSYTTATGNNIVAPHVTSGSNYNYYHGGSQSVNMESGTNATASTGNYAYVVLPLYNNVSQLKYWSKRESTSYGVLKLGYVDAQTSTACNNFTTLATVTPSTTNTEYTIDFENQYTLPAGKYIAFQWNTNGSYYACCIDDVCVTTAAGTAPASLPYTENFENGQNGWEFVNGTRTNKWYYGAAGAHDSSKGLFISNNGTANEYTITSASAVWAYREINFEETKDYVISFDWKAYGESCCDYLRAGLVPSSTTLTDGESFSTPTGWIDLNGGNSMNVQTSWQRKTATINVTAGTYKLAFCWRNDGSVGTNPPAAIDNIDIHEVATYNVTVSANGSGTVSGGGSNITENTSVTVTATPNASNFINWTENGTEVSTDASYTFIVESDRNLVANFEAWGVFVTSSPASTECLASNTQVVLTASTNILPQSLGEYTFFTGVDASKWYNVTSTTNIMDGTTSGDYAVSTVHTFADGFSFPFAGTNYTQFSVNADGNLRLGGTVTGTSDYSSPFSSSYANSNNPKINGMGFDGFFDVSTYGNYVHAQIFGEAPNRVYVVEFKESPYSSGYRQYTWNWQVQLSEDGTIQIVYGDTAPGSYNYNNQIGLCVNASDGWTVSTTTHEATHFTNGTSTTNTSATSWPGNNRYYRFSPVTYEWTYTGTAGTANGDTYTVTPTENSTYTVSVTVRGQTVTETVDVTVAPAAPTVLSVSNITTSSATVSWSGNASSYSYSIDGTNWTTTSSTTANLTGLTMGTTYTFQVKAVGSGTCESGVASTTFTTPSTHTITVSANPAVGGMVTGGGTYNHNDQVTITASANTSYTFTNWTKNGTVVSSNNPYSFNATEDATYTANFSLNQHTLTINYVDGNGATVAPQHTSTVSYGNTYTVASPAVTGYTPDQATVSGTMPDSDVTVTVTYSINSYQLTIVYEYADHSTAATTYTEQLDYGESYNVASPAITCYSPSLATVSGNMPDNNLTVTVTYTMKEYTIIVASDGNGSVSIANASGSQVTVSCGTEVTVTATPDSGYSLVNWTNDLNATTVNSNPYQFTADETIFGSANSITLTANFDLTPPSFTTTVNSVTDNSANLSGSVTYGGNITEYGFCWNTTGGTPTTLVDGSYYRVNTGTAASFTQNITGFTSNTLYYVWSYVVSNSNLICGDRQTFTTLAQVTTASATNVTTYDATMGGSWATGGGATITGCGVVYGTGNTPTIGDGTSTQVTMVSPSSPFTLQNSSNLQAETTYYVRAYVTNAGGTSYGSAVPFTTLGYYGIAYMVSPAASDGVITFNPAGDGHGQGTKVIPVGTGTNASQLFPFSGARSFDKMLYPALTIDGNAVQGDIQSISFYVKTKATGAQNPTFDIYLMETSSTTLPNDGVPVANLCYHGTVNVSNLNDWVDITLDTPFAYQGGNLVVAIDHTGSGAYTWASTDATGKSLCFMSSATSNGYINGDGTAFTEDQMGQLSSNQLPNAKFTIATASGNTEWCSYGYTTTATASTNNPDYIFDHWTVDGTDVSGNTPTYPFSNITADHTITANFVLSYKRFINDGNWNVAANWSDGAVPDLTEEVAIEAHAVIPSGVIGYADNIRPITHANGSITIQDGGQLIHNNASNNMVTVTVEDTIRGYGAANANTNKGYEIVSFPVDNLTAGNSAITGAFTGSQHPFDFYSFYASEDPLEWLHQTADSTLSLMKGYIYASQDGTTIRVTGPVMSSANDVNGTAVDFLNANAPRFNGWALLGNPFVCNAYVSLGTNNGAGAEANFYKLYNNTDYDEFIPFSSGDAVTPMGGVMFRVYDDDNIVYSRTAGSGAKTGILNVDVRKTTSRGTTTIDRARVRFGEGRNLEKFQFDTRHTKVYIPEGDQDFSVYYADGAGTIPVNFKAQDNGRYTLDFSTEDVGFNYLHLIDNMNGNDVDLLQTPYYAFDAKSTDFASRFLLVFATGNDNGETFAFFNNGVWIINNDGKAELQVVDALGRILSSETITGSCSKAINVAPGVYMLRLINGDNVKVQKVVVKR